MTALMFAVKVGSFDVVQMLVENNANIFEMNSVSFLLSQIFCGKVKQVTKLYSLNDHPTEITNSNGNGKAQFKRNTRLSPAKVQGMQ